MPVKAFNVLRDVRKCPQMKRVTISLPEELFELLRREAKMHNISVSLEGREILDRHFAQLLELRKKVPFAAIGRSGGGWPQAADLDEYLTKHWADDIRRDSFSDPE